MFFIFGALLIVNNSNLSFGEGKGVGEFSNLYVGWLDKVYSNVRGLTGEVIGKDWGPE